MAVMLALRQYPQGGATTRQTNHQSPSPLMGEESKVRVKARQSHPVDSRLRGNDGEGVGNKWSADNARDGGDCAYHDAHNHDGDDHCTVLCAQLCDCAVYFAFQFCTIKIHLAFDLCEPRIHIHA